MNSARRIFRQFTISFLTALADGLLASPPQECNIGYILVIATLRGIAACLS